MTTVSNDDRLFPRENIAWYVAGTLVIAWTLAYLDRQIIVVLIEPLRIDMGINDTQAGLIQGFAFALFFAVAGIPLGRLVDRTNRRNLLICGILAWSVMTIACGLATNFTQLFIARMGVGVGEAVLAPATFSLLADYFRPHRRGVPMGAMMTGASVGNGISILLGGSILQAMANRPAPVLPLVGEVAPWQMVFFAVGTPGVLVALLMLTVKEPERRERVTTGKAKLSLLSYARRHPRAFLCTCFAYGLNNIPGYGIAIWAPVLLIRVYGMAPTTVGLIVGAILLVTGPLSGTLGGALADRMVRRWPDNGRLGVLMVTMPILFLFTLLFLFPGNVWLAILAFAAVPVFGPLVTGSSFAAMQEMVPNELRGETMAVSSLLNNLLGLGVATTAIGLVTDYVFRDPMMLSYSIAVVCLPACALSALLGWMARRPYGEVVRERRAMMVV